MELFYELTANAVVWGAILGLICVGYSLAYGSANVVNFAHTDVMILGGGYLLYSLLVQSSFLVSLICAVITIGIVWMGITALDVSLIKPFRLIISFIAGFLIFILCQIRTPFFIAWPICWIWTSLMAASIYYYIYRPIGISDRVSVLITALAVSVGLENLMLLIWGGDRLALPVESLPAFLRPPIYVYQNVQMNLSSQSQLNNGRFLSLPIYEWSIVVIFFCVIVFIWYVFSKRKTGKAVIACADDREAALLQGIKADSIISYAFFIGGFASAIGGTLFILREKNLEPMAGFSIGILAFSASVLGGIGSLRGSVLGGFIVAFILSFSPAIDLRSFLARYISDGVLNSLPSLQLSDWSFGLVYLCLIVAILIRPQGLLGYRSR